jgi:hypothetical protein
MIKMNIHEVTNMIKRYKMIKNDKKVKKWIVLYNVRGYLITSDHKLYNVTPLKTPFGLVIPLLQSQSHVTTITHNYFLRCYAFTQL